MENKICPIRNEPCMTERCAWFEPLRNCCWAIRNDIREMEEAERKAQEYWMNQALMDANVLRWPQKDDKGR